MKNPLNIANAPKTGTFQMRINPEIRKEAESVFATYGLSLTDAVNIFIQQSLNSQGLPFLLSPENAEFMKAKAAAQLMAEIQKGWDSVSEESDWIDEDDIYSQLGVEK